MLSKDVVVYYKLAENQPGRVELIPYRDTQDGPGTFMMVVTPGIDLKPLDRLADARPFLALPGRETIRK